MIVSLAANAAPAAEQERMRMNTKEPGQAWRFASLTISDGEFDSFKNLIFEKSGIHLRESKRELLRTRLGALIREKGLGSFKEYFEFILNDRSGRELVAMLDAVSTNVTSFFREDGHFEYLGKTVAPMVIKRYEKSSIKNIRGWSAGCSSGEEAYSIAITLLEVAGLGGRGWEMKVLATDISTEMLEKGQRGEYPEDKLKSAPGRLRQKYFDKVEKESEKIYSVKPEVKKLISFRRFNLMTARYPFKRKFDFIFCRNVMIYFDRPTQQSLIGKFYDALEPGGALMIGHSESLTGIDHRFKYVRPTIYQKPE
ncbi:MAG: protein-glutamate O-methyltransferase CheR [Nitrospinota bacterium]|nr:protein-glutamate O-methyltransferase CheR [Nitrospinota bacterium]